MFKNKLDYRLINILLLMAIIYILYLTSNQWGYYLGKVFSVGFPFLIAFAIAYILHPFVKFLEEKGVRRKLAIFTVIVFVLLIIVGVLWLTLPLVYDQLIALSKTIIDLFNDINTNFDVNLGEFSASIMDSLNKIISSLGKYVSDGTINLVNKSVKIITDLMIIVIVGIYFLIDMDKIREKIKFSLKRKGKKVYNYVKKLDDEIGNYCHGLLISMVVQLIEYSILFRLVNHPNWLILGVLAAVTTIIPYFGGYILNIVAIITASTVSIPVLIATTVVCFVFSNVDGYIISPKIYGKTNNTNPVVAIFVIGLFSSLFGFVGLLFAMPVYILVKASYDYYRDDIRKKIRKVAK